MTHPEHTPASTDPDRAAAPGRADPDPDRTDCADQLPTASDAPARRTFPAEGYAPAAVQLGCHFPGRAWFLWIRGLVEDRERRLVDVPHPSCHAPESSTTDITVPPAEPRRPAGPDEGAWKAI